MKGTGTHPNIAGRKPMFQIYDLSYVLLRSYQPRMLTSFLSPQESADLLEIAVICGIVHKLVRQKADSLDDNKDCHSAMARRTSTNDELFLAWQFVKISFAPFQLIVPSTRTVHSMSLKSTR